MSARYLRTRNADKISNVDHYGLNRAPDEFHNAQSMNLKNFGSSIYGHEYDHDSNNNSSGRERRPSKEGAQKLIKYILSEQEKDVWDRTFANDNYHSNNMIDNMSSESEYEKNTTSSDEDYSIKTKLSPSKKKPIPPSGVGGMLPSLLHTIMIYLKYPFWIIALLLVSLAAYVTYLNFIILVLSRKFFCETSQGSQGLSVQSIGKVVFWTMLTALLLFFVFTPETAHQSLAHLNYKESTMIDDFNILKENIDSQIALVQAKLDQELSKANETFVKNQQLSGLESIWLTRHSEYNRELAALHKDIMTLRTVNDQFESKYATKDMLDILPDHLQLVGTISQKIDSLNRSMSVLEKVIYEPSDQMEKMLSKLVETKLDLLQDKVSKNIELPDLDWISSQATQKVLDQVLGRDLLKESVTNQVIESSVFNSYLDQFKDQMDRQGLHGSTADNLIGTHPDYALGNIGGRVISSQTGTPLDSRWNPISLRWRLFYWLTGQSRVRMNPPSIALNASTIPGDCWAFPGSRANFTIATACPIYPKAFTIDHVPKSIALHIESAPRHMTVYALINAPQLQRVKLLDFQYDLNGMPVQSFEISQKARSSYAYEYYQLEIDGNWGYHYTCLYRFRVHGDPTSSCQEHVNQKDNI